MLVLLKGMLLIKRDTDEEHFQMNHLHPVTSAEVVSALLTFQKEKTFEN